MKIKLLIVGLLAALPLMAQEDADEKFEDRLARIYKNYNQNEISDSDWAKIAGGKATESYTLQSGDSLWDISETLFGDGFYWPKVWQLNDRITNPHNIAVGNSLKFSSGSDVAPPSLEVQEGSGEQQVEEDNAEEVELESEVKGETVTSEVVIPSGKRSIKPLKKIPDSFPEWREFGGDFDENGFAKGGPETKYGSPALSLIYLSSIISDTPWDEQGTVSEMDRDREVASDTQDLIVKLNAPAKVGDIFTAYDVRSTVENNIGDEIRIKGLVQIISEVSGEENSYRAVVKRAILPVTTDDSLIAGNHLIKFDITPSGPESNVAATIIDGQETQRENFSLHEAVYLNRGQQDGLQNGQILNVYKNFKVRNDNSKVTFSSQVIGKLKVATVGQRVATAVIVRISDGIFPGDETSAGPVSGPPGENPATDSEQF